MWAIIREALAVLAGWLRLKATQATAEREKREAAEYESHTRKKQAQAAADAAGARHNPDDLAERLRNDNDF